MTEATAEFVSSRRSSRMRVLLIAGALVIGFTLLWRHFFYSLPIGEGPAGPSVSRDAFANIWSERKIVLLGLGDSITQGLGASPGKSYFQRLTKNPADEFADMDGLNLKKVMPNIEPLNLSVSGMTSIECVDHQLPRLQTWPKDVFGVVVITVGGNDVVHNYGRTPPREGAMFGAKLNEIGEWKKNFDDRLETIYKAVEKSFPGGFHMFVGDIYDPTDGDSDCENAGLPAWSEGSAVLSAWNGVLREFAKRHSDTFMVGIRAEFLGHGIHCVQFWHHAYRSQRAGYWYWGNLEDPNDRGYDAIRRLYLNSMIKVLPDRLQQAEKAAVAL